MAERTIRLRKTSPIDREFSVYEIVDERGDVLFDIGRSDDGEYEMALFDAERRGRVLALEQVLALVREAQRLIAEDA